MTRQGPFVIFEALARQRTAIDAAFGPGLVWDRMAREPRLQDHLHAGRWRLGGRGPLARDPAGDDLGDGAVDRALRPRVGALDLAALPEQETEITADAVE
jgi:hypothetical protein